MLFYRDEIVLAAVAILLIIIALVLLIPVCFRACWNTCGCCRSGCAKCNRKKHKRMKEDWVAASEGTGTVDTYRDPELYRRLFSPAIYAQVVSFLCIGFIFVAICALTDVPWYVMFILLFLVWTCLYIDYLRRKHRKQMKSTDIALEIKSPSKEKFDAYEAAGIVRNKFRHKIKRYSKACWKGLKANYIEFLIALLAIVIVAGISTVFSSCMCIASSPVEISTYLSRRVGHKYCHTGEICNVYFTLADTETDMIMNFHASESPDSAYVAYDLASHAKSDNETVGEWINKYAFTANATTFQMHTVRELHRWVNWADLTGLAPATTYYFIAVYTIDGKTVATQREYKVKTIPSDGTITFVTGGDMSVDKNAEKLVNHAASIQPAFAMIGGDNAYDNGFKSCYLRWDKWFQRWDEMMTKNPGGYTIPVILAIGNHETGSFGAHPGDDPYYTSYFPQKIGLQAVDPRFRLAYHSHRFGANTTFIVLDSDVVTRMDGTQKEWLAGELAVPSKIKVVTYHGNIYPSAHIDKEMADRGKKHWVPLFDQYNVTMAFENHLHLYKRTKSLRNNQVDPAGMTYFGDGTWGVHANVVPLAHDWYIEKVNRNQHFFGVSIANDTSITVNAIDKSGNVFDSWQKELTN